MVQQKIFFWLHEFEWVMTESAYEKDPLWIEYQEVNNSRFKYYKDNKKWQRYFQFRLKKEGIESLHKTWCDISDEGMIKSLTALMKDNSTLMYHFIFNFLKPIDDGMIR